MSDTPCLWEERRNCAVLAMASFRGWSVKDSCILLQVYPLTAHWLSTLELLAPLTAHWLSTLELLAPCSYGSVDCPELSAHMFPVWECVYLFGHGVTHFGWLFCVNLKLQKKYRFF